jgi:hypothetical protein
MSSHENRPVEQGAFKKGIESTLIAPQNMVVTAVVLVIEALKNPEFDPREMAVAHPTKEQIKFIGEMMDRAHKRRGVPVATEKNRSMVQRDFHDTHGFGVIEVKGVAENRLAGLWRGFQEYGIGLLAALAGVRNSDGTIIERADIHSSSIQAVADTVAKALSDPDVHARVEKAFSEFGRILNSEEGKERAKRIRELNDFSHKTHSPAEVAANQRYTRTVVEGLCGSMLYGLLEKEENSGTTPSLTRGEIKQILLSYAR